MSIRRLLGTAAAMAAAAVGLRAGTPDLSAVTAAGPDLQRAVDTAGADTVLLAAVAVLAWAAWLWGAVGLTLTALSALPGAAGALAQALTRCVLPAGARRAAALALGVGLVAGGPVLAGCTTPAGALPRAVATASAQAPVVDRPATPPAAPAPATERSPSVPTGTGPVPDWPAPVTGEQLPAPVPDRPAPATAEQPPAVPDRPTPAAVPDRPTPAAVPDRPTPAADEHVVLRGDCLWDIAAGDLARRTGGTPTDAEVATAVDAWWQANAAVIGPDPDLLLPGQVLRPPPAT
jgi:hypothetical protein